MRLFICQIPNVATTTKYTSSSRIKTRVMFLCQVFLCDNGSDFFLVFFFNFFYFFFILQLCSFKMGCNSLEEAIGVTDWQFQSLGKGYELRNWKGERKQRQKGITQYCSSGLALFLSECGAEGCWHSQLVCLSPVGTLDNGAELAVLGQFREGREICHSLCIPSGKWGVMMGGKITQKENPLWMRMAFTEIQWGNSPTQDTSGMVISDLEPANKPWNTRGAPGTCQLWRWQYPAQLPCRDKGHHLAPAQAQLGWAWLCCASSSFQGEPTFSAVGLCAARAFRYPI